MNQRELEHCHYLLKTPGWIALSICALILCGCSNIVNTHLHNAVPLEANKRLGTIGFASSSNVYSLHDYAPAEADSTVKSRKEPQFYMQTPLSMSVGLGKGYAIGGQVAGFLGPKFKSSTYYWYMSDIPSIKPTITLSLYAKLNLQKSVNLGRGVYLAVFPALGIGTGVETIAHYSKLRYYYYSVELPLTISKRIEFSNGKQVIISATARTAHDWIDSDLHFITSGDMHFDFDYYYDQPRLEASRNALMGHLDYSLSDQSSLIMQLGMEQIKVKEAQSWEPIVFLGWTYKMDWVGK